MPKTMKLRPHLSIEELQSRYRGAKDPVERAHYQIIWLVAQGKTTTEVMEVTGYTRGWVQKLARRYNAGGPQALGDHRHHNPGAADRALLTADQCEELYEALKEPPPDGGMWNSRKVAEWIEQKTGRQRGSVRAQRGWEYLKRLDRSLKVPRPRHRKANPKEQEAFKKVSPRR